MEDQELAVTNKNVFYISFWKRILMRVIDVAIILIPYLFLYRLSVILATKTHSLIPYIVLWILMCGFYIIMVSRYGGTPGKLLMKAKIVDRAGNKLTLKRSILRSTFYILYAIAMILIFNDEALRNVPSGFQVIAKLIGLLAILSDIFVIFNHEKRALHDYLAGSLVIKADM